MNDLANIEHMFASIRYTCSVLGGSCGTGVGLVYLVYDTRSGGDGSNEHLSAPKQTNNTLAPIWPANYI